MTDRKITEEVLKEIGFTDSGERHGYNKVWRIQPDKYPHHIQFIMGDYPEDNPNVGVLGVFCPEEELHTVPDDLVNKEDWTEEDEKRADEHLTHFDSQLVNIAWHVTSENRLKAIIENLTLRH
jgi:hypothetical protein